MSTLHSGVYLREVDTWNRVVCFIGAILKARLNELLYGDCALRKVCRNAFFLLAKKLTPQMVEYIYI